jgi:flagellar basal body-associated protein FliL
MPDKTELRLSDMFFKHGKENPINLELIVTVYNINKGHNPDFAQRSENLGDYETFVDMVYQNGKVMERTDAIVKAVKDCVNQGILKDFLEKHSPEVINMLLNEFNIKEAQEVWKEEGAEERTEQIFALLHKGVPLSDVEKMFSTKLLPN